MAAEISQLIVQLGDPEPAKRTQAAEQLVRLGPDAQPAAVALVRAVGDQTEEVREASVAALEELGPPRAEDVDQLATLIKDQCPDVGYWAATLLGRLKSDAAPGVPALANAVVAPLDLSIRQRAAWALGEIGPPAAEALDSLKKAASDPDPRLARLANQAIERIGG